jgi:UTP--glucose-1-phosphate uridylyltransferase
MEIKKAVIPAAGFGTRLLPATIAQPKEMLPIVDQPTIQFVVEEAVNSGLKDILIITGKGKRAIEDHFDPPEKLISKLKESGDQATLKKVEKIANLANIHYIRQKEQLGLGHAVLCAESFVDNEPFVVMLGDAILKSDTEVPCTKQLLEIYQRFPQTIIAVEETGPDKISRYGVINPQKKIEKNLYQVGDLIEKPEATKAPSNLAICSRYLLQPNIFSLIRKTRPGQKGEIQLTDGLRLLAKENSLLAYQIAGKRFDIGGKADFIIANILFSLNHPETKEKVREFIKKLKK